MWDVFISHASEDKASIAEPLATALTSKGLAVWFDVSSLKVGDSLRQSIDAGLAQSRFGVVIVSPAFLAKDWPLRELSGLLARETSGRKVLLPIWHDVELQDVLQKSPILADRVATSSKRGLDCVVADLLSAIRQSPRSDQDTSLRTLDRIDRHILHTIHSLFVFSDFLYHQVVEEIEITERFKYRFEKLLRRGYIDSYLAPAEAERRFRLSPSIDAEQLRELVGIDRRDSEA